MKENTELTGDWRNGGKIDEEPVNSVVIKPESRVNTAEPIHLLKCDKCDKTFPTYMKVAFDEHIAGCQPIKIEFAIPNQNTIIIKTIEQLLSIVNDNLSKLVTSRPELMASGVADKYKVKYQAKDDIDIFQRLMIPKLKKAFE